MGLVRDGAPCRSVERSHLDAIRIARIARYGVVRIQTDACVLALEVAKPCTTCHHQPGDHADNEEAQKRTRSARVH